MQKIRHQYAGMASSLQRSGLRPLPPTTTGLRPQEYGLGLCLSDVREAYVIFAGNSSMFLDGYLFLLLKRTQIHIAIGQLR